uniref:Serpentine receptor class gamma n=1 Tax=Strongyloides papillosus TaxID=174720 RepID=A0A0N5B9P7_STREA
MFHLTSLSTVLFIVQGIVSVASWIFVVVGPFYKSLNKDFRKADQEDYSQYSLTHIGTWTKHKVPEMFVPTFFIPIATAFPLIGMFLIRNCIKKNLSGVGKIILIAITIALYVINGILIHYGTRNISLNKKDTIHIGWYIAASLNWFSVIILILNSVSIYCSEVLQKYENKTELEPSNIFGSSKLSGSLSKTQEKSRFSSTTARSGSNLGTRSIVNGRSKPRTVTLSKSSNRSSFVNAPKRK